MTKDTREYILEVSLLLFLQKSFKAVTMKEIVAKTGLSKGAFYHYFESKEKVFEEVVRYYFAAILAGKPMENYKSLSLKSFMKASIEESFLSLDHIEKMNSNSELPGGLNHYFIIFDAVSQIPSFREEFNMHNQIELDTWSHVIDNAKKSKEIKTKISSKTLAQMFMYMGDGYGIQYILLKSNFSEMRTAMKELKKIWSDFYKLIAND